jgi:hypothetical protein
MSRRKHNSKAEQPRQEAVIKQQDPIAFTKKRSSNKMRAIVNCFNLKQFPPSSRFGRKRVALNTKQNPAKNRKNFNYTRGYYLIIVSATMILINNSANASKTSEAESQKLRSEANKNNRSENNLLTSALRTNVLAALFLPSQPLLNHVSPPASFHLS